MQGASTMSWFDTAKLASMANKAMKEAQKTLDSALDIQEEEEKAALWGSWRVPEGLPKSGSEPGVAGEGVGLTSSPSLPTNLGPVSCQPKRSVVEEEVRSSVLGGEDELVGSWEEEGFSTSRLVVQDRASRSPSVELVSPSVDSISPSEEKVSPSVDLVSPSVDLVSSSVDLVSPSVDLVSPSVDLVSPSVDLVSPSEDLASPSVDLASSSVGEVSPCGDLDPLPGDGVPGVGVEVEVEVEVASSSSSPSLEVLSPPGELGELVSSVGSGRTVVGERLAEAMVEEREASSLTSSSPSSDMVKVGSLGGSEVASGDEEGGATATSSDIEVLGHRRGASGGGELEAARARVGQLEGVVAAREAEARQLEGVVAAREARLVAVAREMAELQGEVEEGRADRIVAAELRRRVAQLEAEVVAGAEREAKAARTVERLERERMAGAGEEQEREEVMADLRSEGEALARQNGKQAEVIRKLRAKEKTTEADLTKFKAEAEKYKSEVERLSKSLAEKNGLEGTQSEAIRNLTEANQAWESENAKVKNDLEDNVEKVAGLRRSLEAAYREMAEMKRRLEEAAGEAAAEALAKEVSLRQEAVARRLEEGREWQEAKAKLESQVLLLTCTVCTSHLSPPQPLYCRWCTCRGRCRCRSRRWRGGRRCTGRRWPP